MSETQSAFILAVREHERLKKLIEENRTQLQSAMNALGFGSFAQDVADGVVYQIVKPNGTFMYYRDIDYIRTAKEGERAGTLSKSKAEEAGFILRK